MNTNPKLKQQQTLARSRVSIPNIKMIRSFANFRKRTAFFTCRGKFFEVLYPNNRRNNINFISREWHHYAFWISVRLFVLRTLVSSSCDRAQGPPCCYTWRKTSASTRIACILRDWRGLMDSRCRGTHIFSVMKSFLIDFYFALGSWRSDGPR